ncbi:MAG: non-hydrolyzing UDP-N-acetylglucosamine 2-epimerase, partial [Candidatus Thorarchaeota archaeon]
VEAGLRSYDTSMPEEHNRRLTDHVSSFLFAPTNESANILRRENVWGEIHITGNTVIDAIERVSRKAAELYNESRYASIKDFVLMTLHRAENVDHRKTLAEIVSGVSALDEKILFPAHPRTIARMKEFGIYEQVENEKIIEIIDPVGYLEFMGLMMNSKYILTDSGGIQEEVTAPSINKHAFVLRTSTERPEAVQTGHVTVVGVNANEIQRNIHKKIQHGITTNRPSPYGDGRASVKIIDILSDKFP